MSLGLNTESTAQMNASQMSVVEGDKESPKDILMRMVNSRV